MHPMTSPRAGRVQHAQSNWQPRHLLQDPRSPRNRHSSEGPLLRELEQHCTALETLGCGHTFHRQCIVPWIQYKRTCPICKGPAELVAPGVADDLMLGTSFQASFTPRTPPLTGFQGPLQRPVDTDYVLTARHGTHYNSPCHDNNFALSNTSCMSSFNEYQQTHQNQELVDDARVMFANMGWQI